MPIYIFFNKKTNQYKEIVMSMKEEHEYTDDLGFKWDRIFTSPKTSTDTKIDPFSERDFVEKTGKKTETLGDYWDRSQELSAQREKLAGKDFVKEKTIKEYEKKTKGTKHPFAKKQPDTFTITTNPKKR